MKHTELTQQVIASLKEQVKVLNLILADYKKQCAELDRKEDEMLLTIFDSNDKENEVKKLEEIQMKRKKCSSKISDTEMAINELERSIYWVEK